MKNILSYTKTAIILLLATVLLLGFYGYMLVRPISYGMWYCNKTVYEDIPFEINMKFYPNGKVVNKSTNFDEPLEKYYYYKDGYIFALMAQTDEEYEEEVAYINGNFDEAVESPFYAAKINAFVQISEGMDGHSAIYTCTGAIIFAAVGGVVILALIALTAFSFVLSKRAKVQNDESL